MTYATLLAETDADGIAVVTVNRPDKLNALNAQVFEDFTALLEVLRTDAAVRAVIITGAGPKAFVAGADIGELAAVDGPEGQRLSARGQAVFRAIEHLRKPVIAAVNGFALGGGCELAMACHLRLAAPSAKFGQPEVKLGLIPGYGGTVRLPRLVGRGRALELLLTARVIDAEEALRIGLVERIVPAESLLDEARAVARTILTMGPRAVALTIATVDQALDLDLDAALAAEAAAFGEACGTADKREGTQAFLDKRPPAFTGH
jgi:enoyl-CoA hydratase